MPANYTPFRFLDPASQNTTGRGGSGTSRGGVTYLGAAPVPQSVAPAGGTRLSAARHRQNAPLGSTVTGTGFSGSMGGGGRGYGRERGYESQGQRTPTFLSSDAYFRARGSGLDWLESYGPNRKRSGGGLDLGGATYGGRSAQTGGQTLTNADGTRARSVNQVIDFTTGQSLPATNPYTTLTGDSVQTNQPVMDDSPLGRYNQMGAEQKFLAAEGLEAGRAAASEVRNAQVPERSSADIFPSVGNTIDLRSRYGVGLASPPGFGPRKSFGATRASSPEQSRQDDLGERAIAARRKAGVSEKSLLEDARKRYGLSR